MLCLLCLELCQVWLIGMMIRSERLYRCRKCGSVEHGFGKGIDERPCRSTWWVVSLRPSLRTEICVCDLRFSYYHTLGSLIDSLGFLITLVLCPGVAKLFLVFVVCWGPHAALTVGVGCVAVGTWPGSRAPVWCLGPCTHRLGL